MNLVAVPVAAPLLGAALATVAVRHRRVQAAIGLTFLALVLAASIALLVQVDRDGAELGRAGGWDAPMGIALVVDRFSAIMLVVSSLVLLVVLAYALGQGGRTAESAAFHPVYLVLAAGVSASFVTGDLFNLFVAFEMMLVASYVLITLGGRPDQVRAGMTYVVISLVASTLFVVMLGLLYAATGTLNMADLAVRLPELGEGVRVGFGLLLFGVFGIKAALFPLFFWLPDSYPTAPGPVTAVFAGLLTKVGVYAIIRTQTLIVPSGDRQTTVLLVVAALTMVVGVLGAVAQDDMKRILSFHIISQIGYMIFGLGLFTVAGVAGAVFYVVHNVLVKTALLLVAGLVERSGGSGRLSAVGGLVRRVPVVAALFGAAALSLAGVPPLSGFVGKFALVDAGVAERQWAMVVVALGVGALTLFSMVKIWAGVFWGRPDETPSPAFDEHLRLPGSRVMVWSTAALVAVGLAVVVTAGPLWALSERAASDLLDPTRYVALVLGARS